MERKIYAFGMDGFIVPMMKRFAAEGALPHFERFGPYQEHALHVALYRGDGRF